MKTPLLLFLPLSLMAGDGLYTHIVVNVGGPMVHQLTQEVWDGTNVVQDEWYRNPGPGIDRLIHTTRGAGDSNGFTALYHSSLIWLSSGGELSNFWTEPGPIPIRTGGHTQMVVSNQIHTYSQKFGSTQPRLYLKRNGTNLDLTVRVPVKNQFQVLESVGSQTNWRQIAISDRPLGDSTNTIFDGPITNTENRFFEARTIWPHTHPAPTSGGPFVNVIGKPAWLPSPTDYDPATIPSGPPMPPRK